MVATQVQLSKHAHISNCTRDVATEIVVVQVQDLKIFALPDIRRNKSFKSRCYS